MNLNSIPSTDSAENSLPKDVIGNKDDTTSGDSLVALVKIADAAIDATKVVVDAILVDTSTTLDTKINTIDGLVDGIVTRTTSAEYTTALDYLDAGGEQTLVELTGTTRKIVDSIWADTEVLTQNGTFKVYVKIDGTNYRLWKSVSFAVASDGAINVLAGIGPVAFNTDFKVTYTEGGDEGAARNIPVLVVYRTVE